MAWNQPGNNGQDRDPWGSSKPGGNSEGNGNKGGRDQGPPDLDDIFRKLSKKLGGLGGGKGTGSGGGNSSQGPRPQLGGRVVTIAAAAIGRFNCTPAGGNHIRAQHSTHPGDADR